MTILNHHINFQPPPFFFFSFYRKHPMNLSKEEMNVMKVWGIIGAQDREGKETEKDSTGDDSRKRGKGRSLV